MAIRWSMSSKRHSPPRGRYVLHSRNEQGIILRGPTRPSQGWQMQVAGAYTFEQFTVDWEQQEVCCPQGKRTASWQEHVAPDGKTSGRVRT